jgi:hypothetical protein
VTQARRRDSLDKTIGSVPPPVEAGNFGHETALIQAFKV